MTQKDDLLSEWEREARAAAERLFPYEPITPRERQRMKSLGCDVDYIERLERGEHLNENFLKDCD